MKTYELQVGPITRQLPILPINDTTAIASFVLLGDAELTDYAAQALAQKVPAEFDYFVTLESKGIPLAQELSRVTAHPQFVVLRKLVKDYMQGPLTVPVKAITTNVPQQLVLDGADADRLVAKKVVIVDDVISSGGSLNAARALVEKAGATVVGQVAILAEGDAVDRSDIAFLAELPLFPR
ncbi:phosphoribosyltransferase family protein [Levilactobacillus tujiorum]|uniref:Adenine phosphoribosyltransferase n=1 Tax=Levilactobacillus tujiorum TaxID=2912243 RepID=A0ABX1L4X3_9LACO|nr:phosphoribosyltransferase family protein [Levilactobacillus tujiorum]MCH5464380.1 adenine phosphoribosyltransferase [Levilactobacillus tujiorum]NLR11399.1 adenine phosphoribosyltransferase [Lactobacillus sp. HBUAS51387]NLR29359.1 adenine phosphoribosyltransferase [Levilactobacillus tujiorum]